MSTPTGTSCGSNTRLMVSAARRSPAPARKLLIARALGAKTNDTKQEFYISTEDRKFINDWLLDSGIGDGRTIVAMQPGAFVPTRQWKSEGFIEIAKKSYQK